MSILWKYPDNKPVPSEIKKLSGSDVVAQILVNRGIDTSKKVNAFFNDENYEFISPDAFNDMQKAVDRVDKAITNKENIVVYGDFDCDGVTSTSVLYKTLGYLGANVSYYIPDRAIEGHGLNSAAIIKLISSKNAKLIITVDNGISNNIEIKLAQGFNVDVIVTDHHEAPEILPEAFAILNPKSPNALDEKLSLDEIESLTNLAGVGVAYKLAWALLKKYSKEDFLDEILPLVAIGTVADVVPLIGENRSLVKKGIVCISEMNVKRPKGIIQLLQSAGANLNNLSSETVAFSIAPRVNAAGRLDNASTAVELFVEDDDEKIEVLVKRLNQYNQNRQQLCDTTFMEADFKTQEEINFAKNKGIILFDSSWHPGIIGIVASKLVEKYNRPVFMMTLDKEKNVARCSARSTEALHLYETLKELSDILQHFGGHACAAGFSLDLNTVKLNDFIEALNAVINSKINDSLFEPYLNIDAVLNPEELNFEFIEKINQLAPFGAANPSPLFSIEKLSLRQINTMGSGKNHLKLFFADENNNVFEAVWWNKEAPDIEVLQKLDVAFCPKINSFNGKTTLQLDIKDIIFAEKVKKEEVLEQAVPKNMLLDHRKKVNIYKSVNNYLKMNSSNISVFAEDKDIISLLCEYSEIKTRLFTRVNIEKSHELMIFDYPADICSLKSLINKVSPAKIHLMPFNIKNITPNEIIKKISGMLKFAHSHKDGNINIPDVATNLSCSNDTVTNCIKLLGASGVIDVIDLNTDSCSLNFIKSKELSVIVNFLEYKALEESILHTQKFRHDLSQGEISKICEIFDSIK